jgi:hypothetical protein
MEFFKNLGLEYPNLPKNKTIKKLPYQMKEILSFNKFTF